MELFLPGIAALLIIGLIVFLILPRFGAPVLAALSLILLAYGVSNHIALFSSEWRYSTWQDRLKFYGPFVIIGAMILVILSYMGFLFGTQGASALPNSNIPIANAEEVVEATNNVINNTMNSVVNNTKNMANAVGNALGFGNRGRANNRGGIMENLGNILRTPVNAFNRKSNNRGLF